jgi:N-acetylglucosaminyldiphosphoundecaprenol N-acetyl-beta-D-mannosaminyltransferase
LRDIITILGVPIDRVTKKEAGKITEELIQQSKKTCKMIFAPNVEFIMMAQKDKEFFNILQQSSLSTPDSIGVMIGAKLQKKFFPERIPGQSYFREIIELSNKNGYSIYLLGGAQGIAQKAKQNLEKEFPKVNIVGVHEGYFNEEEEKDIIKEINNLKPNILFVALGAPRQEKWIFNHRDELKVDVATGQGGTYDYEAGKIRRAPKIVQKIGMEWFWRLCRQPKRIIRQRVLPIYLIKLIFAKDKTKGRFSNEDINTK